MWGKRNVQDSKKTAEEKGDSVYTIYQSISKHYINFNTKYKHTHATAGLKEWRRSAKKLQNRAASCQSFKGCSEEVRMKEYEGGGVEQGKRKGCDSRRSLKRRKGKQPRGEKE